ncbi:cytochrome C assembly family protein [Abyssibacter profundi]|uniref:Cytochrome c assembly protein domain-containing protein n=1 Tax=Abyssibacter profundi TaxID=2182787 RepID=A0A363UP04_9GAMM|nr:cytochrome c biogenesis protein CcsA [Abyssibacter profundi]PWN57171.1 hypothetical protein DEH80_04395 [Abyssibacter profundi]
MDPVRPMLSLLPFAALLAYAVAAAVPPHKRLRPAQLVAGTLGILLHGGLLLMPLLTGLGLQFGVATAVSLVAWQSALMLLLFASREPVGGIARWVFAAALIGVAIGLIAPGASPRVQLDSWLLTTHIACSALAYGVLTLAAMQAAALWLRDRRLHSHPTPASTTDTVPLQTMERVLFQMIGLGFSLLTLSLASGLVVTQDVQAQHLTHKLVFTVVAWAVFAVLLAGRWRLGWRGRTAIRWMATGYAVLGLAYFGSKWVLETLLQTHWG